MTYTLLIAALGAVFISFLFVKRRTAFLISGLTLSFGAFLGSGLPAEFLLNSLQKTPPLRDPAWKTKNLIILLCGGNSAWPEFETLSPSPLAAGRIFEALRLYEDCKKQSTECRILISGGDPSLSGKSEASVMAEKLMSVGVTKADLLLEEQSRNTIENARESALVIGKIQVDRIVLVTSGYHLTRSHYCFARAGIEATPAPADRLHANSGLYPHAENLFLLNLALHEYGGIAQAWFKSVAN